MLSVGKTRFSLTLRLARNNRPVVAPITPMTVKETNTLQFTVEATDADGDAITWTVPNAPVFLSSVPSGNNLNVTLRPEANTAGTYTINFIATDVNGGSSDPVSAVVTVEFYDPNYVVKVNFRTQTNGPSDWNNAGSTSGGGPIPTLSLNKENGTPSGITLTASGGDWVGWKDEQGISTGIYPTPVNRSFLEFSGAGAQRTLRLQGLNPQGPIICIFYQAH
jgi:hypothetical protein